ncbi:MAG: S-layer protein, partial [Candidatus Diapherotrites archaeon]|nr:S-layer protein [Candidatus Diapherotrites archaeon]
MKQQMKGLNIKKLAAVAVGTALVGSALAPVVSAAVMNNAGDIAKADLVNTATGAPLVQVAVGTDGAAVSDFVWAGNIAAKVAQLSTTEKNVEITGGTGDAPDPTITDKTVDLMVGGTVSYSTDSSHTYQDTNYALNSGTSGAHEFIHELTQSQLKFLTLANKSYRYNGASYTTQVKEKIVIDADAKFEKADPVKDLALFIDNSNFKYVLEFGDGTKDGIPAMEAVATQTTFNDGDTDSVVIPVFGENYSVSQIDKSTSTSSIRLIQESGKSTFYQGNEITGLQGRGAYEGQELKIV